MTIDNGSNWSPPENDDPTLSRVPGQPSATGMGGANSDTVDAATGSTRRPGTAPGQIGGSQTNGGGQTGNGSSMTASDVADATKDVAHEASAQMSNVAGQAKEQLHSVVDQAKTELRSQADARSHQAADALKSLAGQLSALTQGRPHEAGQIGTLLGDAQQRVQSYARTLEDRGPQAIAQDIAMFARRRPVSFLITAGVLGFAAGRLTRSSVAVAKEHGANGDMKLSNGQTWADQPYSMQGQHSMQGQR